MMNHHSNPGRSTAVIQPEPDALESDDVIASEQAPISPGEATEHSELELCFNEASNRAMNLPDGYSKAAILLISWVKTLDSLKVASEVSRL